MYNQMIAYTYVYNEAEILPWTVRAMLNQGIGVYALDNWSTDGTRGVVDAYMGTQSELWPPDGPPKWFDLVSLLGRIERIHAELQPAWGLLFGADEILAPCWPDLTMRQALERVYSEGYNAVDFCTVTFHPIDNNWTPDQDPESYFKHWTPGRLGNIRAWCSGDKPIKFLHGGHKVEFEGIRVYPLKFAIKHYPFRTQAQSERKVFVERRPRYSPLDRAKGWHTHMDHIQPGYSFIKDPRGLRYYDPSTFFEEIQEEPVD